MPVLLQDESSTAGTATIIDKFTEILNISPSKASNYLLFDPIKLELDISGARKRYILLRCMEAHRKEYNNIIQDHTQRQKSSLGGTGD